jgi:response regulator RpfG family c-di-GMP phosphodiesterase
MDGQAVLEELKSEEETRHIPVIVISGMEEKSSVIRCIKRGAEDYLAKPFDATLLKARIGASLETKRLRDAERELLEKTFSESIHVLTDVLSLADPMAFSRASRLKIYVRHMGEKLELDERWQYEMAAMLSQIGFISIPEETVAKLFIGEELTGEEQEIYESHAELAAETLSNIPRLQTVTEMVRDQLLTLEETPFRKAIPRDRPGPLGAHMLKIATDFDKLLLRGAARAEALKELRRKTESYDSSLVGTLDGVKVATEDFGTMPAGLDALREGMLVDENIRAVNGTLLVAAGQKVTTTMVERLRRYDQRVGVKTPVMVVMEEGIG